MLIARREQDVRAVALPAVGDVGVVIAVGVLDVAVRAVDLHPLEALAGDEVDDARDRVGAVRGGGAVLQHFDALDRRSRKQVDVDTGTDCGIRRHAAAVEQHERAQCAEAAQVDVRRARRLTGAELVGIAEHTLRSRQRLDQLDHRRRALLLQVVGRDDVDRQRGVLGCAPDVGAGDDDDFDLGNSGIGAALLRESDSAVQGERNCGGERAAAGRHADDSGIRHRRTPHRATSCSDSGRRAARGSCSKPADDSTNSKCDSLCKIA
jgi:hypothetical protein